MENDELLGILDMGEWKYSRHLPANERGYVNLHAPETLAIIRANLNRMQENKRQDLRRIGQALVEVGKRERKEF